MSHITANRIRIAYDDTGDGEPVVLVHGGWSDRRDWDPVAGELSARFRVVAYDRRGHGASERPTGPRTRVDQEDDLGALIEGVVGDAAHVVGTSFGGAIALGLASRRPELVRSVVAHEPPLLSVVAGDPRVEELLAPVQPAIAAVRRQVLDGDAEGAARRFVEEVALGPGSWELLPPPERATMVDSAPAFVIEQEDPAWAVIAPGAPARIACPVLMTKGDASPAWFLPIVDRLGELIPGASVHAYTGAGHAPHISHPAEYRAAVTGFLAGARTGAPC